MTCYGENFPHHNSTIAVIVRQIPIEIFPALRSGAAPLGRGGSTGDGEGAKVEGPGVSTGGLGATGTRSHVGSGPPSDV